MPSYQEPTHMAHPDKDITTLEYVDGFINVDSGNSVRNLESALGDIIRMYIGRTVSIPVAGQNTLNGRDDVLVYRDPIGRYMEVKDVDSFVLFGQRYRLEKTGDVGSDGRQHYRIIDADRRASNLAPASDGCYYNPSYDYKPPVSDDGERLPEHARVSFDLDDIRIWTETVERDTGSEAGLETYGGYEQMLCVEIPSEAIPMRVMIIRHEDNQDYSYRTNQGGDKSEGVDRFGKTRNDYYAESTPFRLFYSVGLADELIESKDDFSASRTVVPDVLDRIDADYLAMRDPSTGSLRFYSNWYSRGSDGAEKSYPYSDGSRYGFGDAIVSFSPHPLNGYYVWQDNSYIYAAADQEHPDGGLVDGRPGAWIWRDTGGSVGYFVASEADIDADRLYYVIDSYWEVEDGKAVEVYHAVPRYGAEFSSSVGDPSNGTMYNDYLCWAHMYVPNDTRETPHDGYVLAVRASSLRSGDMSRNVREKDVMYQDAYGVEVISRNDTGTAGTYYLPTVGSGSVGLAGYESHINVYLGNNGRLSIRIPDSDSDTDFIPELPVTGGVGDASYVSIGFCLLLIGIYAAAVFRRRRSV